MVFAIHWHESATSAHVSPHLEPPPTSLPPSPIPLACPRALSALFSCIKLRLVIYFTWGLGFYNKETKSLFASIIMRQSPLSFPSDQYLSLFLLVGRNFVRSQKLSREKGQYQGQMSIFPLLSVYFETYMPIFIPKAQLIHAGVLLHVGLFKCG